MAQIRNNAAEARSVLRDAINNGVYPRGSRLPSTRELANRFGINRNTATKIYHELAEDDLIELAGNRPPVVVGDTEVSSDDAIRMRLRSALRPLLHESLLVGMSVDSTREIVHEIADEFLESYRSPTIYVAECNEVEARGYAQELTTKLGSVVRPVLLADLPSVKSANILVVPYFHLQEAREYLGTDADHIIGMVVTANSSDISRIATMVTTGPVGIVSFNIHAARRLRRLLGFQIEVPMLIGSLDQPETIDAMAGEVECVVCTGRADRETWQRLPHTPTVVVRYHADDQSIDLIRNEIRRLGQNSDFATSAYELQ